MTSETMMNYQVQLQQAATIAETVIQRLKEVVTEPVNPLKLLEIANDEEPLLMQQCNDLIDPTADSEYGALLAKLQQNDVGPDWQKTLFALDELGGRRLAAKSTVIGLLVQSATKAPVM